MDFLVVALVIVSFIIYLVFLIPAFMFTWEEEYSGIGCYGCFCLIIGFPGAILALIIKAIKKKANIAREKNYAEERRKKHEKERYERELKEREYKAKISKLRELFHNSEITKEIKQRILKNEKYPYLIDVSVERVIMKYENFTDNYVLNANGFPNLNHIDECIALAEVLNENLYDRYTYRKNEKVHEITYSDGEHGCWVENISVVMNLKPTRSF